MTSVEQKFGKTSIKASGVAKSLRIGMVAPPWFAVPPSGYGGTEAVVASLVDGLVDRGHEVFLIAAGTNGTKAQRYLPAFESPPTHRLGVGWLPEIVLAAETARAFANVDLEQRPTSQWRPEKISTHCLG